MSEVAFFWVALSALLTSPRGTPAAQDVPSSASEPPPRPSRPPERAPA